MTTSQILTKGKGFAFLFEMGLTRMVAGRP